MTAVAMTVIEIATTVIGAESAHRAIEVGHHIDIHALEKQAGIEMAKRASPVVMKVLERHKVIVVSIPIPLVQIHATKTNVARTAMTDTTATT